MLFLYYFLFDPISFVYLQMSIYYIETLSTKTDMNKQIAIGYDYIYLKMLLDYKHKIYKFL